ncbi:MAG TPA: FHA domain-containing protein [Candidatus Dormibacteraeota bacterium]
MAGNSLLALRAADGATVTLERYPILLGRSVPGGTVPDVDVSHLDPGEAVENRHVELLREPAGVAVHDLGGTGGTWVDGRRLAPGGRALLEVGGALRVAGIFLTLIEVAGSLPPPPSAGRAGVADAASSPWLENGPAQGVPPPPSAGPVLEEELEPPTPAVRAGELDLDGVPVLAREPLERGATLVRIRPGAALEVLQAGRWSQQGKALSPGAAADAIATARRALDLPEDSGSGEGHVGDAALEFIVPPLTDRPYLVAEVAARAPAEVRPQALDGIRRAVLGGESVLVIGPWPEPALAALAEDFETSFASTRVLSFASADWWMPAGWPALDPQHPAAVQEALRTGELFLNQPPEPILEAVVRALPRPGGGTVLALRSRSVIGGLEQLARQVEPGPAATAAAQRAEVARLFSLALAWLDGAWRLATVGVDDHGGWSVEPAPGRDLVG